jgi:hypothetical protein
LIPVFEDLKIDSFRYFGKIIKINEFQSFEKPQIIFGFHEKIEKKLVVFWVVT